jgi:hypothetical protein
VEPEDGIVEPEETAVVRQRLDKDVSASTDSHATIENCWKRSFLCARCRGYIEEPIGKC